MPRRQKGWSTPKSQADKDAEREARWHELRLTRVREYVRAHVNSARRVDDLREDRLTTKQFVKTPMIYYTAHNRGAELIFAERVFRQDVCRRMPFRAVLVSLWKEGLLNRGAGGLLVARSFPDPLDWAQVVSISPKILDYRTSGEEEDDEDRKERRYMRRARWAMRRELERRKRGGPPGPDIVVPMFAEASRRH
jgi:hypothetical protein